jgi:hypothetical protein
VIAPIAISTLGVVLIVVGAIGLLFFIGGLIAVRARDRRLGARYEEHVAAADAALEQARASDRGWDRDLMESAAREAIESARPGFSWGVLQLVLVDDRPGVEQDRAHFVATGDDGEARVILAREGDRWVAERVE